MNDYAKFNDQQLDALLKALQADQKSGHIEADSLAALQHELQVYQVKLEMQNRDLRDAQNALEISRQRYLDLYQLAPVGYLQLNKHGRITEINKAGAKLLGKPISSLVDTYLSSWPIATTDQLRLNDHLRQTLANPGWPHQLELITQNHHGQPCYLLIISQATTHHREHWECLTMLVDITDRIRVQTLEHIAQHDPLTGLANRNLLMQRLELALQRASRHGDFQFALLFVDLNGFKAINDNLGHGVGDQTLIAVAELLQRFVRQMDLAARLGGDEFVILLEGIIGPYQAEQIAERIVATLERPLRLSSGRRLTVSACIGIVSNIDQHENATELLDKADIAMYQAKRHGARAIEIFHADMHAEITGRLQLEQELGQALEADDELLLYFQPIVELDTGRVRELEALVRWQHPDHGLLKLETITGPAKEAGLAVRLGEWTLWRACRKLRRWRACFPAAQDLVVSVSISPPQYQHRDFSHHLEQILKDTGLSAQYLNLELTEHQPVHSDARLMKFLAQMTALGITVSIDEFGTGYTKLAGLPQLDLKYLKMDPDIISQLEDQDSQGQIAVAIIQLAKQLNLDVVAAGIETPGQRNFLYRAGCRLGQGGLLSPPIPEAVLEKRLSQNGEGALRFA